MTESERPEGAPASRLDLDHLLHHTELPQTGISRPLDTLVRRIGEAGSWVWVVLIAAVTVNVLLRYVLGKGLIEFEEIQWHLYAIGFLIGLSYTMESDDHVRIDMLYEKWSLTTKAWMELFGLLLFLLPFIALILIYAVPFIGYSFSIGEVSESPGGLPLRWAIKAFLFIGFALLAVTAFTRLLRVTALLFGVPKPIRAKRSE